MFKAVHRYAAGIELNAFEPKARALFARSRSLQFDLAAGAEHTMPGQAVGRIDAQEPSHCAVVARIPGCSGDGAVGADFTCGDGKNHAPECKLALLAGTNGIAQQLALTALEKELIQR